MKHRTIGQFLMMIAFYYFIVCIIYFEF